MGNAKPQRLTRIWSDTTFHDNIIITDANYHYLKNVLRCQPDDFIEILTPEELQEGRVFRVGKRDILINITGKRPVNKVNYSLTVYQSILKREYMDTVVEKYAELGVTKIVPVVSERSIKELKESSEKRFHEIAKGAILQSEQEQMPTILPVIKLDKIVPNEKENYLFYERKDEKSDVEMKSNSVSIMIGPEGGFTSNEVSLLESKGFKIISPISSILKAETAAILFAGMTRVSMEKYIK